MQQRHETLKDSPNAYHCTFEMARFLQRKSRINGEQTYDNFMVTQYMPSCNWIQYFTSSGQKLRKRDGEKCAFYLSWVLTLIEYIRKERIPFSSASVACAGRACTRARKHVDGWNWCTRTKTIEERYSRWVQFYWWIQCSVQCSMFTHREYTICSPLIAKFSNWYFTYTIRCSYFT